MQNMPPPSHTPPSLSIDWQAYLPYLEDHDIPDAQKRELIATLWAIMLSFVDLGFDLCPAAESCGQAPDKAARARIAMVNLNETSPASETGSAPQPGSGSERPAT